MHYAERIRVFTGTGAISSSLPGGEQAALWLQTGMRGSGGRLHFAPGRHAWPPIAV
jgi:hypothetical protein